MADDRDFATPRFQPSRPARRPALILVYIFGPLVWLVAFLIAAVALERVNVIEIGLAVTIVAFVVSLVVLSILRAARQREQRRFEAHG